MGGVLAGVPREFPTIVLATALGGAGLSLVLAMALPSRSERAGSELTRRLGDFRHAVNAIGDHPTRQQLEDVLTLAQTLGLRDDEIPDELRQLRAALQGVALQEDLTRGILPQVAGVILPPGDICHFSAPVRFGRRKSDAPGQLLLTSHWLTFHGALDVSVAWREVASVQRAGDDLIVSLHNSRRLLHFGCQALDDAARAGVLAQFLTARAHRGGHSPSHASTAGTS